MPSVTLKKKINLYWFLLCKKERILSDVRKEWTRQISWAQIVMFHYKIMSWTHRFIKKDKEFEVTPVISYPVEETYVYI